MVKIGLKLIPNCSELIVRVDTEEIESISDHESDAYPLILHTIDKLLRMGISDNRIAINPEDGGCIESFKEWLDEPEEDEYNEHKKQYKKYIDDRDFYTLDKKGGEMK